MQRLSTIDPAQAAGKTKDLLDATQKALGIVPNLMRTMATSSAALESYLSMNGALSHGLLPAKLRERLALLSAETNRCGYCASAHTMLGKGAGLNEAEIVAAREGAASDPKHAAALKFAQAVMSQHGQVSNETLADVKAAGFTDGEISEIVAHVALNVFTNYYNNVAQTEIDFPKVELFPVKG